MRPAADLAWHVHGPPGPDRGVPEWLAAVRRFRAEVLYADGLRPAFRRPDGGFRDDDPADRYAHHVVGSTDGEPVATMRVIPLAGTRLGFCERLLGTPGLERLLADLGARRSDTWEGSGWAVRPGRRAATGVTALAGGAAVAAELGLRTAIGASGSRYGQLHRVLSVGYRRATGVGPIPMRPSSTTCRSSTERPTPFDRASWPWSGAPLTCCDGPSTRPHG